jgi:hypothetical protein
VATRYTKDAQTGQQGIDFVRRVATGSGCIYRPFESADLGIDGAIEFVNDRREPTGDMVLTQIKSGPSYVRGGRFVMPGDRSHFETWARYAIPVVGIVVEPSTGEARWVDISAHLRKNPERVVQGPYAIEAPARQTFDEASFAAFAAKFTRSRTGAARVVATPSFVIRTWRPEDAKAIRVLLRPIAADYPGFDTWLEHQWAKDDVSKKVVEIDRTIAAYSMWTAKDERNIKLQTFMVGQLFRGTAIGQHLLDHELRTWAADPKVERVFVTVASSKSDLIDYFLYFGFRVEGISANRYPRVSAPAELVMAKHFVRETIRTPADLDRVIGEIARRVWGIDPTEAIATRFGVSGEVCSVPTSFPKVHVALDRSDGTAALRLRLVASTGDDLLRHDDASFMREFYPLRLHLPRKRYLIVPIYARWVQAMLTTTNDAATSRPTTLKLRVDNVYYCYPKVPDLAAGDFVIFYEPAREGGAKAAIGAAIVREAVLDVPTALHRKFASRGVYTAEDVRQHARRRTGRRSRSISSCSSRSSGRSASTRSATSSGTARPSRGSRR